MSKYTTQIRFLCEHFAGLDESAGYNSVNEIITKAQKKIFSFDYPIFDDDYKADLEKKILKHYYTREICAETFGRWQLFLESRLIEIMPYYNQLYDSCLIEFDVFEDVHYSRTGTRDGSEAGESSSSGTTTRTATDTTNKRDTLDGDYSLNGESWSLFSDTPQGTINDLDNEAYLTNATKNTTNEQSTSDEVRVGTGTDTHNSQDDRTDSSEQNKTTMEKYNEIIRGKYPGASYSRMLQEFRETFLNIEQMIIDDLADLFITIY